MPIWFVNPGKPKTAPIRASSVRRWQSAGFTPRQIERFADRARAANIRAWKAAESRNPYGASRNPRRRYSQLAFLGTSTPASRRSSTKRSDGMKRKRRKLYGAAAAAVAKKRRRNPRGRGGGSITAAKIRARHARMRYGAYVRRASGLAPGQSGPVKKLSKKRRAAFWRSHKRRYATKLKAAHAKRRRRVRRTAAGIGYYTPRKRRAGARAPVRRRRRRVAVSRKVSRRIPRFVAAKTARKGKRKMTKAQRSRASKKGWARRRRRGTAGRVVRRVAARRRGRPMTKRQRYRGLKSLRRAKRSIKWERRHGRGSAKAYIRRHHMTRVNPMSTIVDALKAAAPVFVTFYGSRFLVNKFGPMIPGLSNLGQHAAPVTSVAALLGLHFVTKKWFPKYHTAALVGAGLNVLDTIVKTYNPGGIADLIGAGPVATSGVYDEALSGTGEYIATGEYTEELGGFYADTGEYVEMGSDDLGSLNGSSLRADRMLGPVASYPAQARVRSQAAQDAVEAYGPDYSLNPSLYSGIFSDKRGW